MNGFFIVQLFVMFLQFVAAMPAALVVADRE